MKAKVRILFFFITVVSIIAGGVYVYYKAIPPKGKATGIVEAPVTVIREVDKVFRLADINKDKLAEIILLKKYDTGEKKIYVLDIKGNLFNGWPQSGEYPAVGDVNNDGYKEIVNIIGNKIYVYDQSGTQLPGFPMALDKQPITPPILADLDNNGALEIICGNNMPMPEINAVNGNGYFLENWQNRIVMPSAKTGYPFALAAGDVNNDNEDEIVTLASDRIFVFNSKGEVILRSLMLELPVTSEDVMPTLILADFNNDKTLEIMLLYNNEVFVRTTDKEIFNIKMENRISSAILGDSNEDNLPEVVITMPDQKIYVYDNAGKMIYGWPKDKIIGNSVIGDINSDGINEIIAVTKPFDEFQLSAYGKSGQPVNGWPISLNYAVNSTLALGDIDDDRLIEIVFADTEDNIRIIKTCGIVSKGTWPEQTSNIYNNGAWIAEYMLIDKERGISNKNEVLREASKIIPEFINPEFRLLISGDNLSALPAKEIQPVEIALTEEEKRMLIDNEIKKLKDMNPPCIYTITNPRFSNGRLTAYTCRITNTLGTIDMTVMSEIFYDQNGNEIGWNDVWVAGDGKVQYREAKTNPDGGRSIWFVHAINQIDTVENTALLLKKMAKAFSVEMDSIKKEDPNASYYFIRYTFNDKCVLLSYEFMKGGDPRFRINREIFYNQSGQETGFGEYCRTMDNKIQYREAITGMDGNRRVFFDESMPMQDTIENTVAILKNKAKNIIVDTEIAKLKKMQAEFNYSITNPVIRDARLIAYTYRATNDIGTIDMTAQCEIFYDIAGKEAGWCDYGKIADGRIQYREAVTDSNGNRKISLFCSIKQQGTLEETVILLKKMAKELADEKKELDKEYPGLDAGIKEHKFDDTGRLLSYVYRHRLMAMVEEMRRELFYNEDGSKAGYGEYCMMRDNKIRYREGRITQDGRRIIVFDYTIGVQVNPDETVRNLKYIANELWQYAGSLNTGAGIEDTASLMKKLMQDSSAETAKFKKDNPAFEYFITKPKFNVNGILINYQYITWSGNSFNTADAEIFYDTAGKEAGWCDYGRIADGKIQYREAVTDSNGNRKISLFCSIKQQGTLEEAVILLKKMAEELADEKKELDKEYPGLDAGIKEHKFDDTGRLLSYVYRNRLMTMVEEMRRELFYNEDGSKAGYGEYCMMRDNKIRYREGRITQESRRIIVFDYTIGVQVNPDETVRNLKYIANELWQYAGSLNTGAGIEDTASLMKKLMQDSSAETAKFKKENPAFEYFITKPKFNANGILINYQYITWSGNSFNTADAEIFYDIAGKEAGWCDYGRIQDGKIQYREAVTDSNGNRKISLFCSIKQQGTLEETVILLKKMAKELADEKKELDKEYPGLDAGIKEHKFDDTGRLLSYVYRNRLMTMVEEMRRELFYNEDGSKAGYGEYCMMRDNKIRYRAAVVDSDGKRNVFFDQTINQQASIEETVALLKKWAQALIPEYEKFKMENIILGYLSEPKFNNSGILVGYAYLIKGVNRDHNYYMTREIFYNSEGKEIGFGDYGVNERLGPNGVVRYRQAFTDENGKRNVFFDKTMNIQQTVESTLAILKEQARTALDQVVIYTNSEVFYDAAGKEMGYAEYKKMASGRVWYSESLTDPSGNRSAWFTNNMNQTGALEETITKLKNLAKAVFPEYEKLKKENPDFKYEIKELGFNEDGILLKYSFWKRKDMNPDNNLYMNREIFYNREGKETGFGEYGVNYHSGPIGIVKYREALTDEKGNRNVFFDKTMNIQQTVESTLAILKEQAKIAFDYLAIYSNSEVFYDAAGKEIGYAEYKKTASGKVWYTESLTDSAGKRKEWFSHNIFQTGTLEQTINLLKNMARLMSPELLELQKENPNLTYKLFEPQLNEKGILTSYSYGTLRFSYAHREIYYNSEGKRAGFNEYGLFEGAVLCIQYKEAEIDQNGNIKVWFDETMRITGGLTVETALSILKDKAKAVSLNKEIDKLKKMDPALIYTISDPKIIGGKLIGYKCQVTNSIGTINRAVKCKIYYDITGREIGWSDFGKMEDGKYQYRRAVTNPDGGRNIYFFYGINQQGTIENTEELLEKMARAFEIEMQKLKEENPSMEYRILSPRFNDKAVLLGYRYMKSSSAGRQEMEREIFYDANWRETGFGEYGRVGR